MRIYFSSFLYAVSQWKNIAWLCSEESCEGFIWYYNYCYYCSCIELKDFPPFQGFSFLCLHSCRSTLLLTPSVWLQWEWCKWKSIAKFLEKQLAVAWILEEFLEEIRLKFKILLSYFNGILLNLKKTFDFFRKFFLNKFKQKYFDNFIL